MIIFFAGIILPFWSLKCWIDCDVLRILILPDSKFSLATPGPLVWKQKVAKSGRVPLDKKLIPRATPTFSVTISYDDKRSTNIIGFKIHLGHLRRLDRRNRDRNCLQKKILTSNMESFWSSQNAG
jgi:hypothetical protein